MRRNRAGRLAVLLLAVAASLAAEDAPAPGGSAEAAAEPAAEPPGEPAAAAEGLRHEDGATVFETDGFGIALQNRIQFRLTTTDPEADDVPIPGTAKAGDSLSSFRIRRAKTQLEGWFWKRTLRYELQLGWAGSDATGGSATFSGLEDALLAWDATGDGALVVTGGQFKVPFGWQERTSSEKQQLVERSILSGEFTRSRDVGLMLSGALFSGKLGYAAGAFNGNGRNRPQNSVAHLQYDATVVLQPWGEVKLSESDFEARDKPLFALGAEFESRNRHGETNANDLDDTSYGALAVFKYRGLSAFGEAFFRERRPEQGSAYHSDGFQVQAGYFLKRDRLELALRYASWDPTDALAGNHVSERGAAVNYFLLRHRFKLQADFRVLDDDGAATRTRELRLQTQFVF
jgi:hypothetical protein